MRLVSIAALRVLRAAALSGSSATPAYRAAVACDTCKNQLPAERITRGNGQKSRSMHATSRRRAVNEPTLPTSVPRSHYDLFPNSIPSGAPPQGPFNLDLKALRQEYIRLQAQAHPDRHSNSTDKRRAEAQSALINEAYKTLSSPLLRAQHLLSLRGIDLAEDETAKVEDPDLLMEVLEAREQIEEAESENDLVDMNTTNEARRVATIAALEQAFASEDIDTAKEEAVRLRYWENIKESIEAWEKGKPVILVH